MLSFSTRSANRSSYFCCLGSSNFPVIVLLQSCLSQEPLPFIIKSLFIAVDGSFTATSSFCVGVARHISRTHNRGHLNAHVRVSVYQRVEYEVNNARLTKGVELSSYIGRTELLLLYRASSASIRQTVLLGHRDVYPLTLHLSGSESPALTCMRFREARRSCDANRAIAKPLGDVALSPDFNEPPGFVLIARPATAGINVNDLQKSQGNFSFASLPWRTNLPSSSNRTSP